MKKRPLLVWLSLLAMLAWGAVATARPGPSIRTFPIQTVPSGGIYPQGIGIDKSGNVWIANGYSNSVAELSSKNGELLSTFEVGLRPHGLKIDRANTGNIWVQNTAGRGAGAPVSCPDGTTGTVTALKGDGSLIGTFCTDGDAPQHAQFDNLGNIWITNQGSNTVAELTGSGTLIDSFGTDEGPHAISRDSSGNFWIGNYYSGTVTVLSSTGTFIGTIPKDKVGQQPTGNDIDLLGNLWQSVQSLDVVAVLSPPPSFDLIRSPAVGVDPRGVTIDQAGNVFVANQESSNVIKFDSSGNRVAVFKVGGGPENMAVDSNGNVWVTNAYDNTVSVIKGVAVPSPDSDDDSNG
jgi:sugar lactone lactonase YvrE